MSSLSLSRRTHSKSYPTTLKNITIPKDSTLFSSPPNPIFKAKPHIGTYLSTASDLSSLPTEVFFDRTNLPNLKPANRKRVKVSCITPQGSACTSIKRKPLKTPKAYKVLQTIPSDRLKTEPKACIGQPVSSFTEGDLLTKVFHAPAFCKPSNIKKKGILKVSDSLTRSQTALLTQGALSTRITDSTGIPHGVNMLDFTNVALVSMEDLITNENYEPNMPYRHGIRKAEDFNRRLRKIFQGEGLDKSQMSELESSIAEEESDLKLRVFNTKPLMWHMKN